MYLSILESRQRSSVLTQNPTLLESVRLYCQLFWNQSDCTVYCSGTLQIEYCLLFWIPSDTVAKLLCFSDSEPASQPARAYCTVLYPDSGCVPNGTLLPTKCTTFDQSAMGALFCQEEPYSMSLYSLCSGCFCYSCCIQNMRPLYTLYSDTDTRDPSRAADTK